MAVIDWELALARHPLLHSIPFIVKRPQWDYNDSLHQWNICDQVIFSVFIREAEMKRGPEGGLPLSCAFAKVFEWSGPGNPRPLIWAQYPCLWDQIIN